MLRRWTVWVVCGGVVALFAFAPFRHGRPDSSGASLGASRPTGTAGGGSPSDLAATAGASSRSASGSPLGGADGDLGPGSTTGSTSEPPTGAATSGSSGAGGSAGATSPTAPTLATPTRKQLAVLGPLISAMDTGQRAGTPLVLGIATSLVAAGLPGDDDVPAELRPVISALAELIATPGARVNEVTAQNSVYLAQLDRALGELAFANPALNEVVHQIAEQLAVLGRSAAPSSPPGSVFLSDLSILLTFLQPD